MKPTYALMSYLPPAQRMRVSITPPYAPSLSTSASGEPGARSRSTPVTSALTVDVNIVHTWRGDLVVDLVAPDGTAYRLKNSSSSDSADNVIATYTVDASSETAAGTWKLRVQDVASLDTGYINSWKLTF